MTVLAERLPRGHVLAGSLGRLGWGICSAILLLNLLDALLTLAFLQLGLAEEANPLMNLVYRSSPMAFVLVKLAMVQAGILILHHHRRLPIAQYALHGVAAVYVGIVGYHFAFIAQLVWR